MTNLRKKIYLLTDFGNKDYYVAAMKTVIIDLSEDNPTFIDVTHEINPGDILDASFVCWQLSLLKIKNSFVLVVVDPGVGSDRDAIIVECDGDNVLIGPDNGVLYPLATTLGVKKIYSIDTSNKEYFPSVSNTFHGRDIFARALGLYYRGIKDFLSEKNSMVENDIFLYTKTGNQIIFKVVHVDRFGNVITNVPCIEELSELLYLWFKGRKHEISRVSTFSELDEGEIGVICGSSGFYEIVSYLKPANKILNMHVGDTGMFINT